MHERGLDSETTVSAEIPPAYYQGVGMVWDERKWNKTNENFASKTNLPENSAESVASDNTEGDWILTPFGYWVPLDEKSEHIKAYFNVMEQGSNDFFHAWFVTYPKEVWRRLKWNR